MPSMTKKELAELAGYTYRRLHDIDKGLPSDKKLFVEDSDGGFDATAFVKAWVAYNVDQEKDSEAGFNAVKARHEVVKMEKTEIELRKMRGEVVETEEVKRLWVDIFTMLTQGLLNLPSKLGPALVMIEEPEAIRDAIDQEIRATLELVATMPLPESSAPLADSDGDDSV